MATTSGSSNLSERYSQYDVLFCHDLPSKRQPEIGTVLVTGASGYIGGLLAPELLSRGYKVKAMVRGDLPFYSKRWPKAEVVVGDALKPESLKVALKDVHTAYYLIHSLLLGPEQFNIADLQAAVNFRTAAEQMGVSRIIYLGGLGDTGKLQSEHLRSRARVAEELDEGKVPVTVLRAGVIIGSGSAPYEIIQNLVKKLLVILIPHWAKNKCQPIAIRDVIKYLVGFLEAPQTAGKHFDIGGGDILTYEKMMKVVAELLGKKRVFINVPVSGIKFFAYFASLLTPVPAPITMCLMEGLADESICKNQSAREVIDFQPLSYRQAIARAMSREEQDKVRTRWSDAYPPAHELAVKLSELDKSPEYKTFYSLSTKKDTSLLFKSICKIGGKEGWFYHNWMWRMRGAIDRILMGVGSSRGRKHLSSLEINDVLDFWRVEDLVPDKKLLLRAEMKLPGKAWLEFRIRGQDSGNILYVTAYYCTNTLFGHIYWYMFLPFHHFIFADLIKQIEKRS